MSDPIEFHEPDPAPEQEPESKPAPVKRPPKERTSSKFQPFKWSK